ncbi:hypothetical protein BIW11_08375 [Tropilaelaps mercedesae]|uniref:Uncharacterized protein n=1 Tax=Tropilaelaps mercedesae TaxID=418985 RepID=A0A1V9XPZ9_9ACAR|nr:hypothetical protein BIW11_08375 [Tropilaelaps mercedesae]
MQWHHVDSAVLCVYNNEGGTPPVDVTSRKRKNELCACTIVHVSESGKFVLWLVKRDCSHNCIGVWGCSFMAAEKNQMSLTSHLARLKK